MTRCEWADGHPLLRDYHDQEWGVFTRDRERLFEMLILESVQAGLSWLTVLKRRPAYREAFQGFRPEVAAAWTDQQLADFMNTPGIIHNRAKIASHRSNAQAFLLVEEEFGGFDQYLLQWTGHGVLHHAFEKPEQVPAQSPESERLSRDLMKRGFRFVGPTICYSFLQAIGLATDHLIGCFRYTQLGVSTGSNL
ncbi:DNA-3-methyladenine glycosylase I [Sulfobacillus harzensis]|uniref:DNA-3-methyladenine glycosylase I n=1 Tax=Sulfobacillus harzensis TaxID=2729629 RepID=A0A7Y0L5I4_9FIRM|nr:DNA-3-methyladenine glycosylase I [Sulfobacillus harzensis]